MRVISGIAGSIPLKTIEDNSTRPTTDRIKETLFNMIGINMPGSVFLDVCAGSGAIGIEALSRGAEKAYFIELNPKCINIIKENLNKTKLNSNAVVLKGSYQTNLSLIKDNVDYVFIDPPYNNLIEKDFLITLKKFNFLNKDSIIIIEASLETDFSYLEETGYELIKTKQYKTNKHVFVKLIK